MLQIQLQKKWATIRNALKISLQKCIRFLMLKCHLPHPFALPHAYVHTPNIWYGLEDYSNRCISIAFTCARLISCIFPLSNGVQLDSFPYWLSNLNLIGGRSWFPLSVFRHLFMSLLFIYILCRFKIRCNVIDYRIFPLYTIQSNKT